MRAWTADDTLSAPATAAPAAPLTPYPLPEGEGEIQTLFRPRGVAFSSDGRYAAITGVPRGASGGSVVWMVDLGSYTVVSRVTVSATRRT